jgi:hypothetical protein
MIELSYQYYIQYSPLFNFSTVAYTVFLKLSVFLYSDDCVVPAGQELHIVNPVPLQSLFCLHVEIIRKCYFTIPHGTIDGNIAVDLLASKHRQSKLN